MGVSLVRISSKYVATEHTYKVSVIVSYVRTYVRSWKTVANFNEGSVMCVARATSLPSSTVDSSTGEDNIIMF